MMRSLRGWDGDDRVVVVKSWGEKGRLGRRMLGGWVVV